MHAILLYEIDHVYAERALGRRLSDVLTGHSTLINMIPQIVVSENV